MNQESSLEEEATTSYEDLEEVQEAVQEEESNSDDNDDLIDSSADDEEAESDDDFESFAFLQKDLLCSIWDKAAIPKSWILLESQSSVDVFCNSRLRSNI